PISFEQYMTHALYHPEYGYYTSARLKLASNRNGTQAVSGDFVTAPELSPWFGRTLALAITEVLSHCIEKNILEYGAGSGILAKQILDSLEDSNTKYYILELSSDLKNLQQQTLADYKDQVVWLDQLPESFIGCVIANEVLDAMPVRLLKRDEKNKIKERYVD